MSTSVLLAAAPDAVAPIKAAVLALAAFLIGVPISLTDTRSAKKTKSGPSPDLADSDQPLDDQVGAP